MAPRQVQNPFVAAGSSSVASSTVGGGSADFQEIKTITLEWKLAGLAKLFDSSKGESKSKCLKSERTEMAWL